MKIIRALLKVNLCIAILICVPLFSESAKAESCKLYTAKLTTVQVYKEPSEDAERLKPLKRGDEVCYIGEVNSFAIIEISTEKSAQLKPEEVAYVKLSSLWAPAVENKNKTQKEHVKDFFKFWQDGGIADDPLAPFRSLWGVERTGFECTAGKICEFVEEKIEKMEDGEGGE